MTKYAINGMDAAAFRADCVTVKRGEGHRIPLDIRRPHVRFRGRLAQMDRALVSGTRGRGFESHIAYQWRKGAASQRRR